MPRGSGCIGIESTVHLELSETSARQSAAQKALAVIAPIHRRFCNLATIGDSYDDATQVSAVVPVILVT